MVQQAKQSIVDGSINGGIQNLREDASRVVKDLSNLSQRASEIGKERTSAVVGAVRDQIEEEVSMLKDRVETLNVAMKKMLGEADMGIKKYPYAFIVGGVGLGLLVGRLLKR